MGVVEEPKGAAGLMNTIVTFCVAPIVLLSATVLVGWNEKTVACQKKALEVEEAVKTVDCSSSSANTGDLVFFHGCILTVDKAPPVPLLDHVSLSTLEKHALRTGNFEFNPENIVAVRVKRSIWACVEDGSSYKAGWVSSPQTEFKFPKEARDACGSDYQVAVPADAQQEGDFFGTDMKAGVHDVSSMSKPDLHHAGHIKRATLHVRKGEVSEKEFQTNEMGDLEYRLVWKREGDLVSALGQQGESGKIEDWKSPADWMCPSRDVTELTFSDYPSKDAYFEWRHAEGNGLTLRVVCFALMWMAMAALFAPLEDCIPCVGPYVGDCCVACFPAAAWCLLVGGIFWVLVGKMPPIPAILLFVATVGAMLYLQATRKTVRTTWNWDGDIVMVPLGPSSP